METASIKTIFQNQFPFLSALDVETLMSIGEIRNIPSRSKIFSAGPTKPSIYYSLEGMVRGYSCEENGVERTLFLRPTGTFFGAPEILSKKLATKYNFEAIEAATIIEFSFLEFEQLAHSSLNFARLYQEALKENLLILTFRVELLAVNTPEERYATLMEVYPQFFQKAYHKYIANYLGMTPNSLSRIIKRRIGGGN